MMKYIQCLFYLFSLGVQYTHSQYVTFQRRPEKTNHCDNTNNNSLVENFFNFLFTEFHNNPPVCVCVQMCYDQPTYCYPNGCLKRQENKKKPEEIPPQVSKVQGDKLNSMTFVVNHDRDHDHSNFMTDYLGKKNYIESKVPALPSIPAPGEFAPDIFKDRYKTLFKYKKMPKVHLRYNLREQVLNKMDSVFSGAEKIDVSKTRWPINKNMHESNKRFVIENKFLDKVDGSRPQFFPSLSTEDERAQFQFQFKRDLTNKNNFTENVKLLDEPVDNTENYTFSLENLLENLIETSFGNYYNDSDVNSNINLDYATNNITTPEPTTTPSKRSIFNGNTTIIINETTVMSLNLTNENANHNKYDDDSTSEELYKNAFKEMIESMSRSIDQQNNSSIENMEQYIGKRLDVSTENISSNNGINTNATINDIAMTTESFQIDTERSEGTSNVKSRQKVTRKQKRKIN